MLNALSLKPELLFGSVSEPAPGQSSRRVRSLDFGQSRAWRTEFDCDDD